MPSPPLIIPSASGVTGVTRLTYRQRLAKTLGYFATGSVTTLAASLEAERYVISSSMRSDSLPPDQWDSLYLSVTSGVQVGECRKLIGGGYEGTNGVLTVDYPFAAALATGTTFEIATLPADPRLGAGGLNEIVNEALEALPIEDIVPITVTATSGITDTEYSLAGYSWPIKSVQAVIYPRTSTTHERRLEMPKCWDFELDAELPVLSFRSLPANVGDVIEVRLRRPANTRIRQSGTWGDTTAGLTADADAALYDVKSVVNQARPIALRRMGLMFPRGSKERANLEGEAADEQWAAALSRFYGGFRRSGAQKVGAVGGR